MAIVEIRDNSVWFRHINDERIVSLLSKLEDGEVLALVIDGELGFWARMEQGRNLEQTEGLRPAGRKTREWWNSQQPRRGDRVELRLAEKSDIEALEATK